MVPSIQPTNDPTIDPTIVPTVNPTKLPTMIPTEDDSARNKNSGTSGLDDVSVSTQLWIIIVLLAFNLIAGIYCCRMNCKIKLQRQKILNDDRKLNAAVESTFIVVFEFKCEPRSLK